MKILLLRFEKNILHYFLVNNLIELGKEDIKIEKITFSSSEGEGKKCHQILEELKLLYGRVKPDLIVYHSGIKYMGKIDEVRYSNESFLNFFCFNKNYDLLEINKTIVRKKLKMKSVELKNELKGQELFLVNNTKIAKSNKLLESLGLLLLIKNLI